MLSFWKNKINSTPTFPLGQLKNFDRHPMVLVCRMAIEIFQSPPNNGGTHTPPFGDQKNSIAIQHTPIVK
jgi:hypothetical protein